MSRPIPFLSVALCVTVLSACGESASIDAQSSPDTASRPVAEVMPGPADTAGLVPAAAPERDGREQDSAVGVALEAPVTVVEPQTQDDALRLLQGAAARYSAIRSMRADFAMETHNPLLRESIRSRGELLQRRPDRILLRFEDPAGDIIVSDGSYIWVWYPSLDSAQVVRTPAASGAGGVDLLAQFVGDPTERFHWSVNGNEAIDERMATELVLDPRGEEAYRQLVVWIDREDFLVRRFQVTEHSGVVRRIDLRGLVIDPDLPDTIFQFTPPAGARIIGGA